MSSQFTPGQGFFAHTPSWHRGERKVLDYWPGTWEEARREAGITWEPESVPIYELVPHGGPYNPEADETHVVPGYQRIIRSDNRLTLGIQSKDYAVISNTDFGRVIEALMGAGIDLDTGEVEQLLYEGVFELYEGRQVFALVRLDKGIVVPGDISPTYRYACFYTRHDGNGGLRCVITNVRTVCANTAKMMEAAGEEEKTAFTIRHSANWDARVAEVRDKLAEGMMANARYFEICEALALKKVSPAAMEKMVKRFLPIGDDMGTRQVGNREAEREVIRTLIKGPTISDEHRRTPYGFLQAATEWSDHYRPHRTQSSYVTRQLVSKEPLKVRAFGIAKQYAGVR